MTKVRAATKQGHAKKKTASRASKGRSATRSATRKKAPKKAPKKAANKKHAPGLVVVGAQMVGDRLTISMSDQRSAPAARAASFVTWFEEKLRREGPDAWIRPDRFFALLVRSDRANVHDVIAAVLDFARPALKHSHIPEELLAWSVTLGDWHVVYYYSLPDPHGWQEGEEHMVTFGDLPAYLHVTYDRSAPDWDAVVIHEGGGGEELRTISQSHSDFPDETMWSLVQRMSGLTLEQLQQAICKGEPSLLVHERKLVRRP